MKDNTLRTIFLSVALIPVIGGTIINAISISKVGILAVALMIIGIIMALTLNFRKDPDRLLAMGLVYWMGFICLLIVLYHFFNLNTIFAEVPRLP